MRRLKVREWRKIFQASSDQMRLAVAMIRNNNNNKKKPLSKKVFPERKKDMVYKVINYIKGLVHQEDTKIIYVAHSRSPKYMKNTSKLQYPSFNHRKMTKHQ